MITCEASSMIFTPAVLGLRQVCQSVWQWMREGPSPPCPSQDEDRLDSWPIHWSWSLWHRLPHPPNWANESMPMRQGLLCISSMLTNINRYEPSCILTLSFIDQPMKKYVEKICGTIIIQQSRSTVRQSKRWCYYGLRPHKPVPGIGHVSRVCDWQTPGVTSCCDQWSICHDGSVIIRLIITPWIGSY